jgi:hypothetical protein
MKDELFQLLDGDLPDDATAELMHLLSVDPDKRAVFRQQLKLQGALYRNEGHSELTPTEEAEMLNRVGAAVGVKQGSSQAGSSVRPGLAGIMVICLMLGTGFGYLLNEWTGASQPDTIPPPSVQVVAQPEMAAPPVVPFDRDSLVSALRDSVVQAYTDSVTSAQQAARATPKKSTVRKRRAPQPEGAVTGERPRTTKRSR